MIIQTISRGLVSWRRVKEVLDSTPELKDGSFAGETGTHGEVELRDVSFAYPGSDRPVLEHVNLKIHEGEKLAIIGATGCGKSSLVNLIPRFYDCTQGQVLVDGVDVKDYSQRLLREKISVVLQKSELFSVSIRDNISWGSPTATDDQIKEAAVIAQADDFISAQPDGYNQLVAERGMSLSGGQKQRISIARAVLKQSEIMIFDDSTSALDLKTEANLYNALENAAPQSTKIIIAQRIATVRRADRIVVLEKGKIAGCGSHDELLSSCGAYQAIYDSQLQDREAANE